MKKGPALRRLFLFALLFVCVPRKLLPAAAIAHLPTVLANKPLMV
jgi:hypothetical protein